MASRMCTSRMTKELKQLMTSPPPNVAVWLTHPPRITALTAVITPPTHTPFVGGSFTLSLTIPPEYPLVPPVVRFTTPIYHPNVDARGRICFDLLKSGWKPSLTVGSLLTSIVVLMGDPNGEDGLDVDATEVFRRGGGEWERRAREHTRRFAVGDGEKPEGEKKQGEGDAKATAVAAHGEGGDAGQGGANAASVGEAAATEPAPSIGPAMTPVSEEGWPTAGAAFAPSMAVLVAASDDRVPQPPLVRSPSRASGTSPLAKRQPAALGTPFASATPPCVPLDDLVAVPVSSGAEAFQSRGTLVAVATAATAVVAPSSLPPAREAPLKTSPGARWDVVPSAVLPVHAVGARRSVSPSQPGVSADPPSDVVIIEDDDDEEEETQPPLHSTPPSLLPLPASASGGGGGRRGDTAGAVLSLDSDGEAPRRLKRRRVV